MNSRRSASVGALPREKKHYVSRNESASGLSLDVRCACQYFQSDSLLPERINPVDSRPASQLGVHGELDSTHGQLQEHTFAALSGMQQISGQPMNMGVCLPSTDQLSVHSHMRHETDVMSMPAVDLSFVEKYPELDETAKTRGLVVRSISDATDPDMLTSARRPRQMSVGGLSLASGMREADNISVRSGLSLRRLPSSSSSRGDLFVADINIPAYASRPLATREQRSVSASRRTSHVDLTHFSSHQPTPVPMQPPQLNLIAATPSVAMADSRPDFTRETTPIPAIQDFRIAKPPASTDYMRPDENKENLPYYHSHEVLPQNRPIDVSKYGTTISVDTPALPDMVAEFTRSRTASPVKDALFKSVEELETLATTRNIVEISDKIKLETRQPPTLGGGIPNNALVLEEQTNIDIVRDISIVDIKQMVQSETEKAIDSKQRTQCPSEQPTTTERSQLSPTQCYQMDTLELSPVKSRNLQTQTQLKRQHTPERSVGFDLTDSSKKTAFEPALTPTRTINGAISVQEASPEAKSSYASRFKAMFSAKSGESPREKSPTPNREISPGKLMSILTKSKNAALEIKTGSHTAHTAKSETDVLSVKVTETFSLKVDEMDQYSSRPPPQVNTLARHATPSQTVYSSREDFSRMDIGIEAFAPVVIQAESRTRFLAGNRTLYSSEIDMHMSNVQRAESEVRGSSKEPSVGFGSRTHIPKGALISVPINIDTPVGSQQQFTAPIRRAPSEQRFSQTKVVRKTSFTGDRTQSQDRARIAGSHEDLYASRMTKTVSFNFDERKSRLSDFENSSVRAQEKQEQNDFLERTYFSR